MARVQLTQETILKHFMERNNQVPAHDDYWENEAKKNHLERGGSGTMLARRNTLLLVKPGVWSDIIDGSQFGEDHNPPPAGAQLSLTIDKEDIDRIITTQKNGLDYDVIYDVAGNDVVDATFLCNYDPIDNLYTIVHFEGLGN